MHHDCFIITTLPVSFESGVRPAAVTSSESPRLAFHWASSTAGQVFVPLSVPPWPCRFKSSFSQLRGHHEAQDKRRPPNNNNWRELKPAARVVSDSKLAASARQWTPLRGGASPSGLYSSAGGRGSSQRDTETARQGRVNMFDTKGIPFVLLDVVCVALGMFERC